MGEGPSQHSSPSARFTVTEGRPQDAGPTLARVTSRTMLPLHFLIQTSGAWNPDQQRAGSPGD